MTTGSFTVNVAACVLTGVQIVQQSGNSALVSQSYILPNATAFSYQLAVIQIPSCGYAVTSWTVAVSSSNNTAY
jgi:hypothetical protein